MQVRAAFVRNPLVIAVCIAWALWTPELASAQNAPAGNPWSRGTTVNVFAGVASASSETGPLGGMALGWEITPWVAVEGSGSWLDRRRGDDAFAADLKAVVNVTTRHPIVPFVEGGVGLYRAMFDRSPEILPAFYQRRIAASAAGTRRTTFTDPSFVVGAGVQVFITPHVALRPDVEAKIVRRDSENYVVTAASVHLAYHFEAHRIAPVRLRRP